jgi:NADH:ubiquinone oxidoreductase subunit 4 (subunit M)
LLALVHFDSFRVLNTSILYIWGHSLSTACIFICINIIESRYNTRNPINLSGLYSTSPLLATLTLLSIIIYLDFPLTLFFFGELYFWKILFFKLPIIAIQILFLIGIIFITVFFKYWWGILYGAPSSNTVKVIDTSYNELIFIIIGLLIVMYFVGITPSLLSTLVGSSIN